MTRTPDPGRKGGPHDPVAQSIRNEQMRDAAPSPKEVAREYRQFLADEGCEVCDESDPDNLGVVHPYHPPCAAYPTQPLQGGEFVFCDEHHREPRELWWAKRVHEARNHDAVAVVEYGCGDVEYATRPEPPDFNDPECDSWDDIPPSHRPEPEVPIRCRCGETIDAVHMLGGVE